MLKGSSFIISRASHKSSLTLRPVAGQTRKSESSLTTRIGKNRAPVPTFLVAFDFLMVELNLLSRKVKRDFVCRDVGSSPSSRLTTLLGSIRPLDGRVRLVTQECTESLHSPDFDTVDTTEQATVAKLTIRKQLRMANRDGQSNSISDGLSSNGQTTNLEASGRLLIAVESCSPAWSSAFTTH
jgi:hypothetical protein